MVKKYILTEEWVDGTPLRTMSAALLSVYRLDGSARRPRIRRRVRPLRTNDAVPAGGVVFRYSVVRSVAHRSGGVGVAFGQAPTQRCQVGSIEQVKQGDGGYRIAGQL